MVERITKLAADKLLGIMKQQSLDPEEFAFQVGMSEEDKISINFTKDFRYDDFVSCHGVKLSFENGLDDLIIDYTTKGSKEGFLFLRRDEC